MLATNSISERVTNHALLGIMDFPDAELQALE